VLRDQINTDLKGAMKPRDERRVSTLRLITATFNNAEIEAQVQGRKPLTDEDLLGLLQKMIKQRQESADIYAKAGREELADRERGEIEIIGAYLPKQMSEDDVRAAASDAIKETGAQGMKEMGKVMAVLRQRYAGRMDFGKASAVIKGMLAG
jgi:uncharacterized protein YqeY